MSSFFHVSLLTLALLVILQGQLYCVISYIQPLACRATQNTSYKLRSSSRSDGNDDDNGTDRRKIQKRSNNQKKVKYVDFWGTTLNNEKETVDMADPRHVPFVSTLDVRDGPLPPGAYIMEGKSEFDAKAACRISIDVKTGESDTVDDSDAVIRRLQSCVDAGFDTFQLHDQTSRSLDIIRRMNENTPSYINTNWSMKLRIQPISSDFNNLSTKLNLRHSVLDLIEQTGSEAIDSLKVDCANFQPTKSVSSDDTALEIFEHLIDLQREGWIRSIGVRDVESQKLRHDVMTYFGDHIDFEEQEGSLLLPPFSSFPCISKNNMRIANALADGLLTDLFSNNGRRGKITNQSSSSPQPLLTNDNIRILKDWVKRRERQQKTASTSVPIWKQYQEHVVSQLNWIALKHDVSMSAVALRWALECGSAGMDANGKRPIVSSVFADIVFDDPKDVVNQKLAEFRQVFRFQLDEEDRDNLSDLSANQHDEQENLDIDFSNSALWL